MIPTIPARKGAGLPNAARSNGLKKPDGCGVVLRGTSAPGGPQMDGQIHLERFNNPWRAE
ncbi:MAG: hypothetical protein Fur0022_41010 [Anaerolineales bacterium]